MSVNGMMRWNGDDKIICIKFKSFSQQKVKFGKEPSHKLMEYFSTPGELLFENYDTCLYAWGIPKKNIDMHE